MEDAELLWGLVAAIWSDGGEDLDDNDDDEEYDRKRDSATCKNGENEDD